MCCPFAHRGSGGGVLPSSHISICYITRFQLAVTQPCFTTFPPRYAPFECWKVSHFAKSAFLPTRRKRARVSFCPSPVAFGNFHADIHI